MQHNSIYVKMGFCYCCALSLEIIEPVIRRNAKKTKGKLTKADFAQLSEISFVGKNIVDIKLLSGLTSTTNISLIDNEVVNVKPLEGLEKLERLQLQRLLYQMTRRREPITLNRIAIFWM